MHDHYEPIAPELTKPEIGDYTPETYVKLLSAEGILPKGNLLVPAQVFKRKHDSDGNPVGIAHNNPILDTGIYKVQFPDGHAQEYAANVIADNIYSQVDADGNRPLIFQEITDHKKDHTAVAIDDKWIHHGCK